MQKQQIRKGFSKLNKEQKIHLTTSYFENPAKAAAELKSFWHNDPDIQKKLDEFAENTISNFFFPYGIAPNFVINGNMYLVPMVIEESSVIAAASNAAKFWSERGGFHAEVLSKTKIGQVHFIWEGEAGKLHSAMPEIREKLIMETDHITENMRKRGGGILDIELIDMSDEIDNYFQLKASFETIDSMGANFINSCLEEFGLQLKRFLKEDKRFKGKEEDCEIVMAILSNYTPECLVKTWVECDIEEFDEMDRNMDAQQFVRKFELAVRIAQADEYRATTHNKGVMNGIDAVVLATGNDFRAIEACAHTFAARDGKYTSLTDISIENGKFRYELTVPLAMGTVGGLTSLHPLAKFSLELLNNPGAEQLMMIAAAAGLANNFSAVKSLTTKGIQVGHMKMHLYNILNHIGVTRTEKEKAVDYFKDKKVSFSNVKEMVARLRKGNS
ncbi:MAG: hydroxymethylglutaryl-CoA reductase, degradative [Bacteroidales bacterium]|nr:hydroxymethylglutaryl-CoA reductase, degradative [Bacteroidales bacterium]